MYKKDKLNLSLITSLMILIQSSLVYAEQPTAQDKRSFKTKSDDFAFSICAKEISKDPKAIKAVTGVTTVASLCGCLKSEMNLLVDDQLAKNLGVALNKAEKSASLTQDDKDAVSDWGSKYSASMGGCVNKASRDFK